MCCAFLKSCFRLVWDRISTNLIRLMLPDTTPSAEPGSEHGSDNVLPLRVVHLSDTLSSGGICFHTPSGWGFHVISHTWSQGLRDLSEKIGKEVCSNRPTADQLTNPGSEIRAYDLAFHDTNLRGEPCFAELMRFLELLATDGVEGIWIDALCINQTDLAEKSREIARMGDYYQKSKGCYVLTHGIDQGYKMWKSVGAVPRWFTRVWTLQELVLPQTLLFIVTDLSPRSIAYINHCVLKWGTPEVGFCKCILSQALLHGLQIAFKDHPVECPSDRINCGTRLCEDCGAMAIRKVQVDQMQEPVYVIERKAYLQLAYVDATVQIPVQVPLSFKGMGNFFEDQNRLLEKLLKQEFCRPNLVIKEICNRQCSVEEDRVLAILGLLNVRDTSQLRVGKTLREQIIAMAKAKLRSDNDDGQDFLMEMMVMDIGGCDSMKCMSWAPDFRTNEKRCDGFLESVVDKRRFKRCVEVGEVTGEGKLRLEGAKVARVRVSVDTSTRDSYAVKSSINFVPVTFQTWGSQGFKMDIKTVMSPFTGGIVVAARNRNILNGHTFQFDAYFLRLLAFTHIDVEPAGNLFLICLNKPAEAGADSPSHINDFLKIGLLHLDSAASTLVFQDSLPCVPCSLSGPADQGGLEDAYFNCSSPHPLLKWIINEDTFEIQECRV